MKKSSIISLIIAIGLLAFAIYHHAIGMHMWAIVKDIIAVGLLFIVFKPGRIGQIVFGHIAIVAGAMLITGGILIAPFFTEAIRQNNGNITPLQIFANPLFWGFISTGGGVCSIYHGFCRCVRHD
ncbi:MAG: hypothetical protein ACLFSQ_04020 [Candidatus Zixiibacteriota bacterium]